MSSPKTFPIRTIHYCHDGIRIIYEDCGQMKTKYLFFDGDPDNKDGKIFFFFGKWRESVGDKITYTDEGEETIMFEDRKYQMKEPIFLLGIIPWSRNKIVSIRVTLKVCLRRDLVPCRIDQKRKIDAELASVSAESLIRNSNVP